MKFDKIFPMMFIGVAVSSFLLGHRSAKLFKYRPQREGKLVPYELKPHGTIKEAEDYFAGVVDQWNSYVIAHDGDLPADPYRFMSRPDGRYVVESYEFARHLPPRVNPDLKRNPRYPVFWTTYYLDEVWTCYANGTWDRLPMSEAGADWYTPLLKAGYPADQWKTDKDVAKWLAENKSRLYWDDATKLYKVRSN